MGVVDATRPVPANPRGNVGQCISILPALDLASVITGGDYGNGKVRQPEETVVRCVPAAELSSGTGEV